MTPCHLLCPARGLQDAWPQREGFGRSLDEEEEDHGEHLDRARSQVSIVLERAGWSVRMSGAQMICFLYRAGG
jgi:hypothetical protein